MSKKTFRYLFIIAAAIVAAIALGSSFRSEKTDETRRKPLNLNKTLTNEMSDTSDLAGLDKSITRFMQEWNLQGVSLSIMRNDSLLYAKGYGWADEEKGVRMSPGKKKACGCLPASSCGWHRYPNSSPPPASWSCRSRVA